MQGMECVQNGCGLQASRTHLEFGWALFQGEQDLFRGLYVLGP